MGASASQNGHGIELETAAPMFAASEDRKVVEWNAAAEALLGFSRAEVLGRPCHAVVGCPEPAPGPGPCGCGECFERELATRSGARRWVSVTTLRAANGSGAPLRVHVLRELTAERRLEELLRQVVSTASELHLAPAGAPARTDRAAYDVTEREREVIRLLAAGSSTRAIAAGLGITVRTARNHIQNVLGKLRVHSRVEAVARASARGLV